MIYRIQCLPRTRYNHINRLFKRNMKLENEKEN